MVRIQLNPRVEDYLVRMDWRDAERDLAGWSEALVSSYEAGNVVLLANTPFHVDYDVLNQVSLPLGRRFKKTKDHFFLYPKLYNPGIVRAFGQAFGAHPGRYVAFRHEVKSLSDQLRAFARKVFTGYRFKSWDVSWRFTPTGPEDLHLDSFGKNADNHYLRIFVNVDEKPRRWNVSHRMDDLGDRYYEDAGLASLRGVGGNQFCHDLNLAAFGGAENAGRDGHDRHVIEFDQGDVWLCESRIVSHQIVSGHRLVVTHFEVDPASMRDPEQRIDARAERCHVRNAPQPTA